MSGNTVRFTNEGYISLEFQEGLESFIKFVCDQPTFMDRDKIWCHCRKCNNQAEWEHRQMIETRLEESDWARMELSAAMRRRECS